MDTPIRRRNDAQVNIPDALHTSQLMDSIFKWGLERGITVYNGATGQSQLKKLREELVELEDALLVRDEVLIKDAIGDMYVVLQQVARLEGIPMQDCLQEAWNDIKDRKGTMRFGIFFKQSDIELIGEVAFEEAKHAEQLLDWIALAKADAGVEP